jgi:hypothetical protein
MRSRPPAHGVKFCSIPWMATEDAAPNPTRIGMVAIA